MATFIRLRVLNPEHERWRRGIEATSLYHRLHDDLRVPFTFRVPAIEEGQEVQGEGWPAALAGFPLGQWIADARRFYVSGDMGAEHVKELEKLGMVWSHHDVAWEEGLTAARGWAAENGHLLAPLDAVFQGSAVGVWLKNARAAARRATELEQRQTEGLPVTPWAGALSAERREQVEEIAPRGAPPGRWSGRGPSTSSVSTWTKAGRCP
ncbi:helicase associated domain-containing protein [Streptomyces cinereoruber]|uniref:helicase associated domain-containing protein n=1 Tax=Streptomyces cinereoruber TaxID=67260 RepID=UPI003C2F9AE0